jgi:HD-like signal output (HDOD) protein
VAFGSKLIASKRIPKFENDAFSAGLIHDAGKLVLDPYILQKKPDFEARMRDGKKNFLDAEKEILGFDHAELTAGLCRFWKIPENQTLAIRCHHEPSQLQEDCKLANILHIANVIAIRSGYGTGESGALYPVQNTAMEDLMLSEADLEGIQKDMVDYVEKISNDLTKI